MSAERFKLVVEGLEEGADIDVVRVAVSERFNLPLAQVDKMFARENVTLGDDLEKDKAWHVKSLLEDMNVRSKVIPMPLSNLKLQDLALQPLSEPEQKQPGSKVRASGAPSAPSTTPKGAHSITQAKFNTQSAGERAAVKTVQTQSYRSRSTQIKNEPKKSLKLTHIIGGLLLLVCAAYVGKAAVNAFQHEMPIAQTSHE